MQPAPQDNLLLIATREIADGIFGGWSLDGKCRYLRLGGCFVRAMQQPGTRRNFIQTSQRGVVTNRKRERETCLLAIEGKKMCLRLGSTAEILVHPLTP